MDLESVIHLDLLLVSHGYRLIIKGFSEFLFLKLILFEFGSVGINGFYLECFVVLRVTEYLYGTEAFFNIYPIKNLIHR